MKEFYCGLVLKVSDSVTKALGVMTRWQTDEEEHVSYSDTFKTWSQQDSFTTRWQTDENKEHFHIEENILLS